MSVIRRYDEAITLSTAGAGTVRSTAMSGNIGEIYLDINKACGANCSITITSTRYAIGTKNILKVVNPSTLGAFYYPRAVAHGTTANDLSSTFVPIPLNNEQIKTVVATSSGFSGKVVNIVATLI
jgi:hypothetical protein